MDWNYAIERQHQALLAIVSALYAMIKLSEGGMIDRLRNPLYRKVLALLLPAESAVRRLIMVVARNLTVKPQATSHAAPQRPAGKGEGRSGKGKSRRPFPLFDRRVGFDRGLGRRGAGGPRAEPLLGEDPLVPPLLPPDDTVNATSLCRRLAAIRDALSNLPRQARRYARWRDKPQAERRPQRHSILRPGPPPGLRRNSRHEVHEILRDCHWLARSLPEPKPDTS